MADHFIDEQSPIRGSEIADDLIYGEEVRIDHRIVSDGIGVLLSRDNRYNHVFVLTSGVVSGRLKGVAMHGDYDIVSNEGVISGGISVHILGGESNVFNHGQIRGDTIAILLGGAATQHTQVVNWGSIVSSGFAIVCGNTSDNIVNMGSMQGDVSLGGGNDFFYDNADIQMSPDGRVVGLIDTGRGDDSVVGGVADERIEGGPGADSLDGGGGVDMLEYSSSNAAVHLDLLAGIATGGDARGDNFVNFEGIVGSRSADTLVGDMGENRIEGGQGADVLDGGDGIDVLEYASSNEGVHVDLAAGTASGGDAQGDMFTGFESVVGSQLADTLAGDGGDNRLTGGGGADRLSGRVGADTFVYSTLVDSTVSRSNRDSIDDFSQLQGDRIDISAIDANRLATGDQAFTFVGMHAFKGNAGELHYALSDGNILIQGDVNGDRTADFSIVLSHTTMALEAADFVL